MTPIEKAKDLIEKMCYNYFDEHHNCSLYVAKNCALIAVDELIDNCENVFDADYWKEVKQEINNL